MIDLANIALLFKVYSLHTKLEGDLTAFFRKLDQVCFQAQHGLNRR